ESLVDLLRYALELVGFTVVESDLQRPPVRIVSGREDVRRPIYYRVFHWPSQTSSVVVEPSFFGASHTIFFLGSATTSFSLKRSECSFIWWRIRAGKDSCSTWQMGQVVADSALTGTGRIGSYVSPSSRNGMRGPFSLSEPTQTADMRRKCLATVIGSTISSPSRNLKVWPSNMAEAYLPCLSFFHMLLIRIWLRISLPLTTRPVSSLRISFSGGTMRTLTCNSMARSYLGQPECC